MVTTLPPGKKALYFVLMLLLPVAALVMWEGALRLARYGEDLSLFITLEKDASYWITNPKVGRRYFAGSRFLPATSFDAFRKQKTPETYRIFVLGASTAAGFPYVNNAAFSRQLQLRLQQAYPHRRIEMVNLALPAVSSYALWDFADELVNYGPDLVLIYAGHNEFYGALGSASTASRGGSRALVKTYLKSQHLKLVQLLRSALPRLAAGAPAAGTEAEEATLMARLVANQEIPHRGDLYNATVRTFTANMSNIVTTLKAHGVQVILSDLASNLADMPPFVSLHSKKSQSTEWQGWLAAGRRLAETGVYDAALAAFQGAAALDSLPAEVHYEIAKALMHLNRFPAARQAFRRARDLDALRFRASSDFNAAIHAVGRRHQVPVAAMEAAFAQASPQGLMGRNLFLEHVHPNARGYVLMAQTFYRAVLEAGHLGVPQNDPLTARGGEAWPPLGVTPLDEEAAALRVRTLISNWPFTPEARQFKPVAYQPANRMQELALALGREQIGWDLAHLQLAEYYFRNRQPAEAAREYEALVIGLPYLVTPYLRLGLTLLTLERIDEARIVFAKSLEVQPTALAHKWLGSILVQREALREGIAFLLEALAQDPEDGETLYNLSVAYAKAGDLANAREYAQRLVRRQPNFPGAAQHLQKLNSLPQ